MCICCSGINYIAVSIHIDDFIITVRFYFLLFITIYWLFLILAPINAFAEDIVYECEATGAAAYHTGKGTWHYEEKHDKETKILDQLDISQLMITEDGHYFYRNNLKQDISYLVPYSVMLEGLESWKKFAKDEAAMEYFSFALILEQELKEMDVSLEISQFESMYYVLVNYDGEAKMASRALKRIKFDKENKKISEFTFPHDPIPTSIYYFKRECDNANKANQNKIDFEETWNRKAS